MATINQFVEYLKKYDRDIEVAANERDETWLEFAGDELTAAEEKSTVGSLLQQIEDNQLDGATRLVTTGGYQISEFSYSAFYNCIYVTAVEEVEFDTFLNVINFKTEGE